MNKIVAGFSILFLLTFKVSLGFAQFKDIPVAQIDERFSVTPQRHWSKLGGYEEYRFSINNKTGDEYKLVVSVTLDLACFGSRSFTLGYNKVVYLKPHGRFDPLNDDYSHVFTSGADNNKDCRLPDGDSFTLYRGMRYTISNVVNITQEKAEAERTAREEKERKLREAEEAKAQAEVKKENQGQEKLSQPAEDAQPLTETAPATGNNEEETQLSEELQAFQATMDNYMVEQAKREAYIEQQTAIINTATQNLVYSFYAAEAATNAEQNLKHNAMLEGDFSSVEELEEVFQMQLEAIYESGDALREASSDRVSSTYNTVYAGANEQQRAVGQALAGLGELVGQAHAEKQEQQAIAQLERERAARLQELERARHRKIVAMREQLFDNLTEGGVPLSYHQVEQNELYFFAYSIDRSTIASPTTSVKVSNVFPIGRYRDGSWIFKDALKKQIGSDHLTLIGYYTDKQRAENVRSTFLKLLNKAFVTINDFEYAGIPFTGAEVDDFWGRKKEDAAPAQNSFWY